MVPVGGGSQVTLKAISVVAPAATVTGTWFGLVTVQLRVSVRLTVWAPGAKSNETVPLAGTSAVRDRRCLDPLSTV